MSETSTTNNWEAWMFQGKVTTSLVNKSIAIESFRFKLDFPPLFLIINTEPRLWPLHLNVCPLFKKILQEKQTCFIYMRLMELCLHGFAFRLQELTTVMTTVIANRTLVWFASGRVTPQCSSQVHLTANHWQTTLLSAKSIIPTSDLFLRTDRGRGKEQEFLVTQH